MEVKNYFKFQTNSSWAILTYLLHGAESLKLIGFQLVKKMQCQKMAQSSLNNNVNNSNVVTIS